MRDRVKFHDPDGREVYGTVVGQANLDSGESLVLVKLDYHLWSEGRIWCIDILTIPRENLVFYGGKSPR